MLEKVAPFQRWARDLFELRQRNRLADDPQYLYCLPPGGPRQYQEAYGVQFVEDKEHQRIFVFVGGVDHNWRLIYLDGRHAGRAGFEAMPTILCIMDVPSVSGKAIRSLSMSRDSMRSSGSQTEDFRTRTNFILSSGLRAPMPIP